MLCKDVFELWSNEMFRDKVHAIVYSNTKKRCNHKKYIAHIWMRLSQTRGDLTIQEYEKLSLSFLWEAKKIETLQNHLSKKEFAYFYPNIYDDRG